MFGEMMVFEDFRTGPLGIVSQFKESGLVSNI